MAIRRPALLCSSVLLALSCTQAAHASAFHVFIDTSGLSGTAVMYFDLTNGDQSVDHSATISGFTPTDKLVSASEVIDPSDAGITGTLATSVVMAEQPSPLDYSFITFSQQIELDADIEFDVTFSSDSSPYNPIVPDGFAFSLWGPNGPLLSTDENGVLLFFNIGVDPPYVVNAEEGVVRIAAVSVPEPNPLSLAAAGLLALVAVRRSRSSAIA